MSRSGVTILGATGSIGLSTLDVIQRHADRYRLHAVTANDRVEEMVAICKEHLPQFAVMAQESAAQQLQDQLAAEGLDIRVLAGVEGLLQVAKDEQAPIVMAAIVGAAGLLPTLAAVESGKRVLLANKESLVMAGAIFMEAVARHKAELLPIDSEHNAIFQCLPPDHLRGLEQIGVRKILLTGSGGPFRTTPIEELAAKTPSQACNHPNWSMGQKISVDSATMMNKGLEFIEACWLFNARPEQVEIVLHPQSVIHSMVEYVDGSVIAQLGNPDMRTPIAYGLSWPERISAGVDFLDLIKTSKLEFEAPCETRFPCLKLAKSAMDGGGTAPAILNAANEVAVAAFLREEIAFTDIAKVIEATLSEITCHKVESLDEVLAADRLAREQAEMELKRLI